MTINPILIFYFCIVKTTTIFLLHWSRLASSHLHPLDNLVRKFPFMGDLDSQLEVMHNNMLHPSSSKLATFVLRL